MPVAGLCAGLTPKFVHHFFCLDKHKFLSSLFFLEEAFFYKGEQVLSCGLVDHAMRIPVCVKCIGFIRVLNRMGEQPSLAEV